MKLSMSWVVFCLFLVSCSYKATRLESDYMPMPPSCKVEEIPKDLDKRVSKNPVMKAVFEGDAKRVKELLSSGQDVNAKDSMGYSYLHLAAGVGDTDTIETLIQAGASVNLKLGKTKSTPAHSAVKWGKLTSLETLVKNGADLTLADSNGKTVSDLAREQKNEQILGYLNSLEKKN